MAPRSDTPGTCREHGCEPLDRFARSAAAVEAELDHPGGDQSRPLAPGVAGDVELGAERVEAPLRGALADVQRLGDLGPRRRAAGESALAAVGGDQGGGRRPLLLGEGDRAARTAATVTPAFPAAGRRFRVGGRRRSGCRRRADAAAGRVGSPFRSVPLRLSRSVAISTPPRLSISRWFQETASSSMWMSALGVAADDGPLAAERHRAGLAVLSGQPDARVHASTSIEFSR